MKVERLRPGCNPVLSLGIMGAVKGRLAGDGNHANEPLAPSLGGYTRNYSNYSLGSIPNATERLLREGGGAGQAEGLKGIRDVGLVWFPRPMEACSGGTRGWGGGSVVRTHEVPKPARSSQGHF